MFGFLFYAGSIDAFAAVLGGNARQTKDIVADEIFIFDVVNINVRNGFNNTTGTLLAPLKYLNIIFVFHEATIERIHMAPTPSPGICKSDFHSVGMHMILINLEGRRNGNFFGIKTQYLSL